jgi:hypothetical protein
MKTGEGCEGRRWKMKVGEEEEKESKTIKGGL